MILPRNLCLCYKQRVEINVQSKNELDYIKCKFFSNASKLTTFFAVVPGGTFILTCFHMKTPAL